MSTRFRIFRIEISWTTSIRTLRVILSRVRTWLLSRRMKQQSYRRILTSIIQLVCLSKSCQLWACPILAKSAQVRLNQRPISPLSRITTNNCKQSPWLWKSTNFKCSRKGRGSRVVDADPGAIKLFAKGKAEEVGFCERLDSWRWGARN